MKNTIQEQDFIRINNILKNKLNCKYNLTLSNDEKRVYLKIINTPNFGDRNFSFNIKEIEAITLFDVITSIY